MIADVRIRTLWTTPSQRGAILSAVLLGPLAGLSFFMWVGRPWWDPPWKVIQLGASGVSLVMFALGLWIVKGRRWAWFFLFGTLSLWALVTIGFAVAGLDFWLGLFAVFLVWYQAFVLMRFYRDARRSYINPSWRWYQGKPQSIPNLICQFQGQEFKVARFDREGAFIFRDQMDLHPKKLSKKVVPIQFEFEKRPVSCKGAPVSESAVGYGILFDQRDGAALKDVGDLFESMKGRGYAAD